MNEQCEHLRLDDEAVTVVWTAEAGNVLLTYLGPRLPDDADLGAVATAGVRGRHENQAEEPAVPGLFSGGDEKSQRRVVSAFSETGGESLSARVVDERMGRAYSLRWEKVGVRPGAFRIESQGVMRLPVPGWATRFRTFSGRWAGEMRSAVRPLAEARYHATDSEGRAGHGGGHWLVLEAGDCGAERGLCLAVFLESGVFHDVRVDGDADGRGLVTMSNGAADLAGYLLFSADGENGLMRAAHGLVRTELPAQRDSRGPRKVHLNTWEALGFDMDEASCLRLVDDAAAIGAERFVLDDGWFRGRRDDRTSLGDWTVDADRFPNGLTPLIERCRAKGLDFGLWVEPEMVSPDSELARAHPEWIIGGPDAPTQRNQLMLDLTRDDARAFVFESIDRLLRENDIAYLKWDHNRPLLSASEADEAALSQVGAQMMRDLRRAHPGLEIEACASGGGRIDYEMLRHCRRVWPSDNNDAVERLRIIREWSRFIPLDVLGNHVGPSPNPVTGRRLDMDFRAKVAMFGHMGVEADPGAMTADERDVLAAHIALYKAWRGVIHGGDLYHLRFADAGQTGFLCLAEEGARGLALAARTDFAAKHEGEPVRLPGLAADAGYRVRLLEPWPDKARRYLSNATKWREGIVLPGQAMMTSGLALPLTHPETAWLIALERVG